jgi:signal peptidase II
LAPGQTLALAALGLILGGALGNVIDRLTLGVITDFLEFGINRHYFPVFNIADSCITVGAAIIILSLGIKRREPDLVGSRLNRPVRPGGGN